MKEPTYLDKAHLRTLMKRMKSHVKYDDDVRKQPLEIKPDLIRTYCKAIENALYYLEEMEQELTRIHLEKVLVR
ncbi:hypothetical protein [Rhizobium phage RHEph16]|uniref:Uncharacterized protein n=1 Tax=Rhizobium phage RHEph16 TaxID=2836132 RepID=A0AAE7VMM9_9CAUD|nr:hypothetical protein PP750_gp92 [Rhizobium phage RHEph16]QXV74399.1 hypothetical protein [Rhizobium phage RHEph16]